MFRNRYVDLEAYPVTVGFIQSPRLMAGNARCDGTANPLRRNSSQKPSEELYANFKASFPQLHATTRSSAGPSQSSTSLTEALDVAVTSRQYGDEHDIKDMDPTPRGTNEPWRFTPSLLDPNSFAFTNFANQPPGYYTPTPGGTNTLYHSQAGDLHTPGFSMGLGTPLSLPTSEGAVHTGHPPHAPFHGFNNQALAPQIFQNQNPFGYQQPPAQQYHQPTFAPHQFSHHPPQFEPFEQPHDDGQPQEMAVDVEMQEQPPVVPFQQQSMEAAMRQAPAPPSLENFRYHVTLNAPTAMVKHPEEIPVTYLNKGQAYSIAIVDTQPAQLPAVSAQYRTYVRISFEDEQQRQRPGQCWQLWKEGRGTNEAHQRGGRLQAVEFVDPNQAGGLDTQMRPKIELETASFDGFSVIWSPVPNGAAECNIAVRFNFLSTDFSHSKGVKGIPVRLCAKTELKSSQAPTGPDVMKPEICYCKVKLFRDHGAERKLSNDIAHVKKTIDKLKQQIAQVEAGIKDSGKRKRSGSISKASQASSRPGKVPKHKRTWSMSSASSTSGQRTSQEDDLQIKLQALQDMFTSTRPASVLFLKGEDLDDPDLHPVHLTGDMPELSRVDTGESAMWDKQSSKTGTSSIVSPTPSSMSLHSGERRGSLFQRGAFNPPSQMSSNEWQNMSQTATSDLQAPGSQQHFSPPNMPVRVQKQGDHASLEGWIEALGVDYSYQPPPERPIKPIACFYVQPRIGDKQPDDSFYRAVYLMQRTLKDLVNAIATKSNIEPTKVLRTIRVNKAGIEIFMDDEIVVELPEGQDMVAEFTEMHPHSPMQREWDTKPQEIQMDGDIDVAHTVQSEGYELKLLY